jgi:hypothetical protein
MGGTVPGQEIEIASQVQQLVQRNITDFRQVLRKPAGPTVARYSKLQASKPGWSREQIVKSLVKKPANRSARYGGAAGGVAFLPGVGTGLSVAGVAASTLKLLDSCVEAIDVVALSHEFDLEDERVRDCARLCIVYMSTPERGRVLLNPRPPAQAQVLLRMTSDEVDQLRASADDIVYRWTVTVASWRLSAAAPFGIGAFMGAWTSYAPVRMAVRSAERFFGSGSVVHLEDDLLEDI